MKRGRAKGVPRDEAARHARRNAPPKTKKRLGLWLRCNPSNDKGLAKITDGTNRKNGDNSGREQELQLSPSEGVKNGDRTTSMIENGRFRRFRRVRAASRKGPPRPMT